MSLLTAIINTTGTIALISVSVFAGWQANEVFDQSIAPVAKSAAPSNHC
jgi:hypothetical protein